MSEKQPLHVNARPEELQGRYANIVSVTSQERDVIIDFLAQGRAGDTPQAQLVSRIYLNHFTAKELADIIQKTLTEWEKVRYELPSKS